MQSISTCPICTGTLSNFTKSTDHTVSHETFTIVKCDACDLAITSPRPENDKLGEYYISEAYISHSSKASGIFDRIYLIARHFTLRSKGKIISRFAEKGTLLDYGCGTGHFLTYCKSIGWTINGVEPSTTAREKASTNTGQQILSNIENLTEQSDIITLWHVLEHVPDFNDILQTLTKKMKEHGTLIVAVPNFRSADAEHYMTNWAGYDVPRHLWHFSCTSMNKIVQQNNLKIVDIIPMKLDAYYVSLLSEKYRGNHSTIMRAIKGFTNGLLSNFKARKTGNYSSLIYIIKK